MSVDRVTPYRNALRTVESSRPMGGVHPHTRCSSSGGSPALAAMRQRVGTSGRWCPGWPGCPPGRRRLLPRRPRSRCRPARPSEDGGFDVIIEFCCRNASWRSRSATRFASSSKRRSRSATASRSRSFSCCSRSTPRASPDGRLRRCIDSGFTQPESIESPQKYKRDVNCYLFLDHPYNP